MLNNIKTILLLYTVSGVYFIGSENVPSVTYFLYYVSEFTFDRLWSQLTVITSRFFKKRSSGSLSFFLD